MEGAKMDEKACAFAQWPFDWAQRTDPAAS
jgi:hypothetical protein